VSPFALDLQQLAFAILHDGLQDLKDSGTPYGPEFFPSELKAKLILVQVRQFFSKSPPFWASTAGGANGCRLPLAMVVIALLFQLSSVVDAQVSKPLWRICGRHELPVGIELHASGRLRGLDELVETHVPLPRMSQVILGQFRKAAVAIYFFNMTPACVSDPKQSFFVNQLENHGREMSCVSEAGGGEGKGVEGMGVEGRQS
jgi:hypothetical protein